MRRLKHAAHLKSRLNSKQHPRSLANTCTPMHVHVRPQRKTWEAFTCTCIPDTCSRRCPPRQLLLKRALYLRWQRWSRSPGLIYLRRGIMNSLWHLIFPSLLIWLSAGICTAIHTAWASSPAPHKLRRLILTADLRPLALRMLIVNGFHSLPRVPQAVKSVTRPSSISHCLSRARGHGSFHVCSLSSLPRFCFCFLPHVRIPAAYPHVRTFGVL